MHVVRIIYTGRMIKTITFCRYSKRMGATIPTEKIYRAERSNFRVAVPIQLENRLYQRLYFRNYRGCNAYTAR